MNALVGSIDAGALQPLGRSTDAEGHDFRLLEDFPAMIWRSRPSDGLCDWFNTAWLEFTGRDLADEVGDGWANGVHADDRDECLQTYRAAFAARAPFSMEYRLRRHDGAYRWVLDVGRPLQTASGRFGGYIGVCYDVDDRRTMIERLQMEQTTTTLLMQTLYHDLRSPIATITMAAETWLAGHDGGATDLAEMILRHANRATELLDDVQAIDQDRSGALRCRPSDIDLDALLRGLVTWQGLADHEVDVHVDVAVAHVDPILVGRAVENLVRNALTHTPPGTHVWITAEMVGDEILIVVADDGPGIDMHDGRNLFDPKLTGGSPTAGGFGLGLSLVDRYARAHGGSITLDVRPGGGTRATLRLPARQDAETT